MALCEDDDGARTMKAAMTPAATASWRTAITSATPPSYLDS